MVKNKVNLVIIYVSIFLVLVGCTSVKISNENVSDNDIVDKVKTYETNEYLFNKLEISYSEYKDNIKDTVVSFFPYKDNDVIFIYNDIKLTGKDLEKMASKEWKEHKDKIVDIFPKYDNDIIDTTYEMSGVYDSKDYNRKYVFVKIIKKYNYENKLETHTNRRYTVVKENNEWKIMDIGIKTAEWKDENEKLFNVKKEQYLEKTAYFSVNNQPVEYKEYFSPIQP